MMAHFYGGVHGHRGEATRLGTAASGLRSFSNGWNVGAEVVLQGGPDGDHIQIRLTSGSNGGPSIVLLSMSEKDALALIKERGGR